jgi:hypothetical protein
VTFEVAMAVFALICGAIWFDAFRMVGCGQRRASGGRRRESVTKELLAPACSIRRDLADAGLGLKRKFLALENWH